jgi:aryl-alcohol dehydrogenase-like predicted oxidoreductase
LKYEVYRGSHWLATQDFVDVMDGIARDVQRTIAQVVINWSIYRPGISVVLCGAKRAYQIRETAGAMGWRLPAEALQRIDAAHQVWQKATATRTDPAPHPAPRD